MAVGADDLTTASAVGRNTPYDNDSANLNIEGAGKGCGCLNPVLQMVLAAAAGSFLFGFNMSLLNTGVNAILSEYLTCGVANPSHSQYTTDFCDEVCLAECRIKWNEDKSTIDKVVCPGGYNDLQCDEFKYMKALMTAAVLIGAAVGSMTGGKLMSMGRRQLLVMTMYLFCIGVISSCTSNSFSALFWARLICGYGVGLVSVVCPTYISEVTPAERRGTYGVFHQLAIVVGILVAMLIGLPLVDPGSQSNSWEPPLFQKVWWRFMLGLGIVPVLGCLYVFVFVFKFETPHFYVEKGKSELAKLVLQKLRQDSNVDKDLLSITDNIATANMHKRNGLTFTAAIGDPRYRKVIIVGCLLSAFQQFGGVNVFMTSSNDLFEKAGLRGTMGSVMSVIMALLNCVMTFPTLYLIEKMGRRSLMLIGSMFQFLFVVPAAISYWIEKDPVNNPSQHTKLLAIIGVIGFVVFFALAYGPVLWVYLFEIYPMEIKDVAASAATACNWVAGIIMVFIAVVVENQLAYTLFAGLQLIGTLIIYFFMLETKGLPLGESPFMDNQNASKA